MSPETAMVCGAGGALLFFVALDLATIHLAQRRYAKRKQRR